MNALSLMPRTPRAHAHLDLRDSAGVITWNADRDGIMLRLSGKGGNVTLDLGPEAVAQLKQALSWAGEVRSLRLRAYQPA